MLRKLLFDSVGRGIERWIGVRISVFTGGSSGVGSDGVDSVDSVMISPFSSCSSVFVSAFYKIKSSTIK